MRQFTTAAAGRSAKNNSGQRVKDPRKRVEGFKIDDDVFDVLEPADSAKLMAMAQITAYHEASDEATRSNAVRGLIDFMGACLPAEQYPTFYSIMVDPRRGLDGTQVAELAEFVVDAVAARPTGPSTGSQRSRSTGGRSSTAASRSNRAAKST